MTQKTTEKSLKLKEANKQRTYVAAVKDLDFWLGEVESLLTSEDSGKDLASVQNLNKKHQLVEADIHAHDERIKGESRVKYNLKTQLLIIHGTIVHNLILRKILTKAYSGKDGITVVKIVCNQGCTL